MLYRYILIYFTIEYCIPIKSPLWLFFYSQILEIIHFFVYKSSYHHIKVKNWLICGEIQIIDAQFFTNRLMFNGHNCNHKPSLTTHNFSARGCQAHHLGCEEAEKEKKVPILGGRVETKVELMS